MVFYFEDGRKLTEALVTGIAYDQEQEMYVLSVLGIGRDGISYTEPGKAWFDDEDFTDLMESDELEFPHDIVGRKLKLTANSAVERLIGDENEDYN